METTFVKIYEQSSMVNIGFSLAIVDFYFGKPTLILGILTCLCNEQQLATILAIS